MLDPPQNPEFCFTNVDPDSSFSPLFLKEMKSSEKMIHLRINFSDFLLLFRRVKIFLMGSHHPVAQRVKSKQVLLISRRAKLRVFGDPTKTREGCASRC